MRRSNTLSHRRVDRPAQLLFPVLVLAILASLPGCVTRGTHDEVVTERDRLAKERRDLSRRVERLEASTESLDQERNALIDEMEDLREVRHALEVEIREKTRVEADLSENLEISRALLEDREERLARREDEISRMRGTYDGLVADLEEEVRSGQIQIESLRSGLHLNLAQEILFASGSASLNASGREVLRKVAVRLASLPHTVEVLGHTDNVPIGSRYPSNWELAAARASSVVRLLSDNGVDPTRLRAVSRGEYAPIAANDTAEGRARNRRIEIRLEPVDTEPVEAEAEPAPAPLEPAAAPPATPELAPVESAPEMEPVPPS